MCKEEKEERAERVKIEEAFIHDTQWTHQSSGAPSSTVVPDRLTTLGLPHSDPISAMRPAVYPPVTLEGRPPANENSSFQFDQELGESAGLLPGLYKPAVPDPQHDTWASSSRAYSSGERPPSPTRTSRACSSGSRPRTGIVYPLQPRQSRPDVCITVEASLPEPASQFSNGVLIALGTHPLFGLFRPISPFAWLRHTPPPRGGVFPYIFD